jgi:hypothetical protein
MQRLKGIAALLVLVLTMPLAHACAMTSRALTAKHDCCQHKAIVVQCGQAPSNDCCALQAPVDTASYPVQSASPLILPTATVRVDYDDRSDRLGPFSSGLTLPEQHSPPGLIIAATIVLRI